MLRSCWILPLFLLACAPRHAPADAASTDASDEGEAGRSLIERSVLFEGRVDGYPTFRIPALIETPSGALIAFAEGRQSLRDEGDIDIVMRRSTDQGRTWSAVRAIVDVGADTAGNPAPFVDRSNSRVWLPYCTNPGATATQRRVWLTYSDDDGASWSPPREITAQVAEPDWTWNATGPGRSVQLRSGRIVVPSNHADAMGARRAHVIYSDDHGASWHRGGSLSIGTDESQVAQLTDQTLLMGSRFEGGPFARAFSRSTDEGLHWTDTTFDNDLPDPRCQGSLVANEFGLWMSNAATREEFPRDHVTVRLSLDNGATWAHSRVLDAGPSAYSALATLPDGRMAIAWESGSAIPYNRIRFAVFDRAWVTGAGP